MRKFLGWGMALCVALTLCFPCMASNVQTNAPARVIHVVYDDSGSMILAGETPVDTWCQAKYAMEVFAAMLGPEDSMNIYYMSDFNNGVTDAPPRITLQGGASQKENISKIHDTLSAAGNTPFDTVRKAYRDLASAGGDEKWLVVLTDGEFQGVEDMDSFFAQKQQDINVMFLGMGQNADQIAADEGRGLYFAKADTSKEILKEITNICKRIFESDSLEAGSSGQTVSFDVPMSELVVFAQGADVSINRMVDAGGKEYLPSEQPVTVRYSEKPATNYEKFIADRNLTGSITTFRENFAAGDYQLDISGADTIEVYYKPALEVYVRLTDGQGHKAGSGDALKDGEYTIEFGLIKAGTSEKVEQSPLLGEVTCTAKVIRDGQEEAKTYSSGDPIKIEEGTLGIEVTAHYLKYNSFSSLFNYRVFADKQIRLSILQSPEYELTKDGIKAEEPIQVKALLEGQELTKEQWDEMGMLRVTVKEQEGKERYGDFRVEKSEAVGIYHIYPALPDRELDSAAYPNCDFQAFYEGKHGDAAWKGEVHGTAVVRDRRSCWERNWRNIINGTVLGLIVFVVAGEMPWFKKRLPGDLVRKPEIIGTPKVGDGDIYEKGRYEKDRFHRFCPYRAQTGSIKIAPSGVAGIPRLKVKASGKCLMTITNWEDYVNHENILFNGMSMTNANHDAVGQISSATCISISTENYDYSCILNKK